MDARNAAQEHLTCNANKENLITVIIYLCESLHLKIPPNNYEPAVYFYIYPYMTCLINNSTKPTH